MNTILFMQYFGFFSAILAIYFTFKQLNSCNKATDHRIRWSIIISFCASILLLIVVCQGKSPDFGLVAMSLAVALRGWADRRRSNKIIVDAHSRVIR